MVGQHDAAPPGGKQLERSFDPGREHLELLVDPDSERLEHALCRVPSPFAGNWGQRPLDDLDES
jgi:hypothetical protein